MPLIGGAFGRTAAAVAVCAGLSGCALFLQPGGRVLLPPAAEPPPAEPPPPVVADDGLPWRRVAPGCDFWEFAGTFEGLPQQVRVLRASLADPRTRLAVSAAAERRTLFEYHNARAAAAAAEPAVVSVSLNGTVLGCVADGVVASGAGGGPRGPAPESHWFVFDARGARIVPLRIGAADAGQPAPDGIAGGFCTYPAGTAPVVWDGRPYDPAGAKEHGLAVHRHPRTIVGLDREGRTIYLVVVQGRRPDGVGLTLAEAGRFLTGRLPHLHAAINLDGGYSSMMIIGNDPLGQPVPEQRTRRIPNALHLLYAAEDAAPAGPPPPPPAPAAPRRAKGRGA